MRSRLAPAIPIMPSPNNTSMPIINGLGPSFLACADLAGFRGFTGPVAVDSRFLGLPRPPRRRLADWRLQARPLVGSHAGCPQRCLFQALWPAIRLNRPIGCARFLQGPTQSRQAGQRRQRFLDIGRWIGPAGPNPPTSTNRLPGFVLLSGTCRDRSIQHKLHGYSQR